MDPGGESPVSLRSLVSSPPTMHPPRRGFSSNPLSLNLPHLALHLPFTFLPEALKQPPSLVTDPLSCRGTPRRGCSSPSYGRAPWRPRVFCLPGSSFFFPQKEDTSRHLPISFREGVYTSCAGGPPLPVVSDLTLAGNSPPWGSNQGMPVIGLPNTILLSQPGSLLFPFFRLVFLFPPR